MRPIPQSVVVATALSDPDMGIDVLAHLQDTADRVKAVVPELTGLSIGWLAQQVTFTLVASDDEVAVLDAVQYATGGPCVEAVREQGGTTCPDLLDEQQWQSFCLASARRGIRSTLTLPLVRQDEVVGTVNMYAATPHAFEGSFEEIADIVGGRAADVVRNADLPFTTRQAAEESTAPPRALTTVDVAVALLAAATDLDMPSARVRFEAAALRAGVGLEELARVLIELWGD